MDFSFHRSRPRYDIALRNLFSHSKSMIIYIYCYFNSFIKNPPLPSFKLIILLSCCLVDNNIIDYDQCPLATSEYIAEEELCGFRSFHQIIFTTLRQQCLSLISLRVENSCSERNPEVYYICMVWNTIYHVFIQISLSNGEAFLIFESRHCSHASRSVASSSIVLQHGTFPSQIRFKHFLSLMT